MQLKMKSDGTVDVKKKRWNPKKVKMIIVEFHGQVSSTYKYPINPGDSIKEIVVRVEEQ